MSDTKFCPYCGERNDIDAIRCRSCGRIISDVSSSGYINMEEQIIDALSEKYEIIQVIGRGGMATVYKAIQINLERVVALKVIHPNLVHDEEFLRRFHREAQTAASLNHPNIVMIFDEGAINGVHYMAMEYLEGEDLHDLIRTRGTLTVNEVVQIIAPIAEALDYAHLKGLVHRDVKSANIFITKEGRSVLTDFGIAHAGSGTRLTQAGSVIGTPEYMSPEQAEGKQIDGRSDLFSLGIVMFECLTGNVPFKGDNPLTTIHKIIYDNPPTIRRINNRIPGWMENIINHTLEKSLDKRVPNGKLLAMKLREGKGFSGSFRKDQIRIENTQTSPYFNAVTQQRSGKGILILLVSIVIILVIFSIIYLNGRYNGKMKVIMNAMTATVDTTNQESDFTQFLQEANSLYDQGNIEKALLYYNAALKIQPDNEFVNNRILHLKSELDKKKQIENAQEKVNNLIKAGDENIRNKKFYQARVSYNEVLKLDPNNNSVKEKLKNTEAEINKINKQQKEAEFDNYKKMGDSLFEAQDFRQSRKYYLLALSIHKQDPYIQSQLAEIDREQAALDSARIKYLQEAERSYLTGRLEDAKSWYQKADKIRSDSFTQNRISKIDQQLNDLFNNFISGEMIFVQGGTYYMGNSYTADDRTPRHPVTVNSFYMDKYEVTVGQYKKFCKITGRSMPDPPPWGWHDNHPIVNVSWEDANAYALWAGKHLPTEAEWEYAAKGGIHNDNYKYSGSNIAGEVANYYDNQRSGIKTLPGGKKKGNSLGIYDMSGNVWEWCADYYSADYYKRMVRDNPQGPSHGKEHVLRGGAWNSGTKEIQVEYRAHYGGSPLIKNRKFKNCVGFRCIKNK